MAAENATFAAVQREHAATIGRLRARYNGYEIGLWNAMAARQFLLANPLPEVAQRERDLNERRAPLVETFRLVKQGLRHLSDAEAESLRAELAQLEQEQERLNQDKLSA